MTGLPMGRSRRGGGLATLALAAWLAASATPGRGDPPETAEGRAVGFLAREVPRWSRENHCYSCHNNGDAARALIAAERGGLAVPPGALDETVAWLSRPERWDDNGGDAAFSDKRLARLQFAAALAAAVEAGRVADRAALARAADRVADDQAADGSWPIDDAGLVGTPATYGPPLATAIARRTLRAADPARFAAPIARADRWLRGRPIRNVLDASAALLALDPADPAGDEAVRRGLVRLAEAQGRDGGWGPYASAAAEPFDTALALLAPAPMARPARRRRDDPPRPRLADRRAAGRRELDRDHPPPRRRQLRPAPLHDRMGRAGPPANPVRHGRRDQSSAQPSSPISLTNRQGRSLLRAGRPSRLRMSVRSCSASSPRGATRRPPSAS